ncbi:protein of unknown function [Streptomyces sp. DvalAA-14]|uniref:DUF4265 domain-containing protein n=1 Tax=unclassified Streptomyces TaxID=2593676 RepID=UPI00081B906E|nr:MULTISPECIES: DUF4265 domain-containing protein [unclassified Streptomyces]MYS20219.1 DUF4265 domain-containing protein [Streptomyces sp. SID4948]SCD63818.1 protein of unknown function [Streptomyces sp. DvalAA-14]
MQDLEVGIRLGRHPITIITHEDPIGRGPANYMVQADLSDRQDGWREQLWTRRLTGDRFEVACLPFFTYGICYRDVVTVDSSHLVASVVQKSGHRTFRVALVVEHPDRDGLHRLLHGRVAAAALPHEWLQGTYLSVDLPPGVDPAALVEAVEAPARAGALHWEIDS